MKHGGEGEVRLSRTWAARRAVPLEVPSPVLVLDGVDPALDEALLRRLTRPFAQAAHGRQIIAVSHHRLMQNTADYVLQIRWDASGSRVDFQHDPRTLGAPGHLCDRMGRLRKYAGCGG